jgi:phosphonate transport system substrate-binding protein
MLDRRSLIVGTSLLAFAASNAVAQDWKSKYPEIVVAIVPAENASGVTDRYGPLVEYMAKELGVKVTLRVASDYAAVIEGQKAGNIHLAYHGPASYARAYINGVKTEPLAIEVNEDGTKGYHSVFYVKKDSPYQKIEDLKGKNLGLVDPNSMSGNNAPRFALSKMGVEPEAFFGKVVYAGSHENAVIALQQGTVDVAANWWNDERESALMRMERKGMAKYGDYRIIFKSDMIVNSLFTYPSDLPPELKTRMREAFLAFPHKEKAQFEKMFSGKMQPWQPIDHKAYEPVVELIKFVDQLRKKKSSS